MKDQTVLNLLQSRIGSADWSRWQMQRWSYYDYIRYPLAGATQLTFFSNALGSTDANSGLSKTLEQTNVPKSRTFGQVYFVIAQIRTDIHVLPFKRQVSAITTDADVLFSTYKGLHKLLMDLNGQGVLNLKIGQKDYFDVNKPFQFCPPGFGPKIDNWAASVDNCYKFQQSTCPSDVFQITPPQMIEPEQTFELTIDFPNGTSPNLSSSVNSANPAVDIGVIFDGYVARPVQ